MKGCRCRGTITVFLSLVSVLFLSLICTLVESARLQGARAWAAAVVDLGIYSVFGEYEGELLEKYDVLLLDGGGGTGEFAPERLALRMREFMEFNTDPGKGLAPSQNWNVFPMEVIDCEISGCTLATDGEGAAFYQQAVGNIQENLGTELLYRYRKNRQEAEKQQEQAGTYQERDKRAWKELEEMETRQVTQEQQDQEKEKEGQDQEVPEETSERVSTERVPKEDRPGAPENAGNPIGEIKKIKKLGILGLVVKDPGVVSARSVEITELPSGRKLQRGNLDVEKKYQGAVADGIFQEYLLEHFGTLTDPCRDSSLEYQVEYILAGKHSDAENLKAVAEKLLLLREGANFAFAASDAGMRGQAGTLAAAIAGAAPVPGLVQALELVLLLAWAYGESLLDVRTLLSGGKVPYVKDASTWKLSLENLSRVTELLSECDDGKGTGQSYEDYLRILLCTGEKGRYPMRALDMMEGRGFCQNMRADGWVVKAEAEVTFRFPPVFLRVPHIFLKLPVQVTEYEVKGCMQY